MADPAPQDILSRSRDYVARMAAEFSKLRACYVNGQEDWSGFSPYRVWVGVPVPDEVWIGAEEVKAVPDLPDGLAGAELRAWVKTHSPILERPSTPTSPAVAPDDLAKLRQDAEDLALLKAALQVDERLSEKIAAQDALEAESERAGRELSALVHPEPPAPDELPEVDDAVEQALASVRTPGLVYSADLGDDWPAPLDFWSGTAGLPVVKPEWLPPEMADYAADRAALRGIDLAQVAISGPVVWSALIRESISLKMMADSHAWQEHARLWGAIIGDPSARKGVGIEIADTHFKHLALTFRAQEERAGTEYGHAEKIYQSQLADYYREAKKNPAAPRPQAPERPASNRLWTDDATLESLGKLLSNHARGKLLVDKDELAGWFGAFDAYSNGGKSDKDRPAYLSAYEGKERYIDRATDGKAFHVPTWSLCILGGIQPSVLSSIASKLGSDGMLQRFMLAASRPATDSEERAPDEAATARWQRVCDGLLDMEPHPSGPVRFSPEAQEFRRECSQWLQRAMKAGLEPSLQAALGKWEGLLGRLVLVSHCAGSADKGFPCPEPLVSLATIAQCWSYIREFLFPHATAFYNFTMAGSERVPLQKVAGIILVHASDVLTRSDIGHSWTGWRRLGDPAKRETMSALCEYGWLRAMPDGQHWQIRPGIRETFEERREQIKAQRATQAALMPSKMPNKFRGRQPGED